MSYLSYKLLGRGSEAERKSEERLRTSSPTSTPSSTRPPTPTFFSRSSTPNSSCRLATPAPPKSRNSSGGPSILDHNDALPATFSLLEGQLNQLTSQLQHLADRAEFINEWLDLDAIVLSRLLSEQEKLQQAREGDENQQTSPSKGKQILTVDPKNAKSTQQQQQEPQLHSSSPNLPNAKMVRFQPSLPLPPFASSKQPSAPTSPSKLSFTHTLKGSGKRSASTGDVPRATTPTISPSSLYPAIYPANPRSTTPSPLSSAATSPAKPVPETTAMRELRERIAGMRKWRKEVERSVVWMREERWRVERAMGRKEEKEGVLEEEEEGVDGDLGNGKEKEGTGKRVRWSRIR
ncbi:MAG: hypothetical protein LQ342_007410 [Letrouitia transgressa]|nr:MAG: hypothetical protein LQ342_007410 [Letrouitia transgressa]